MEFEIGARVRLKAETAGSWKESKLNTIARTGRSGTVERIFGTAEAPDRRSYFVQFDVVRKNAEPVVESVRVSDLERVNAMMVILSAGQTWTPSLPSQAKPRFLVWVGHAPASPTLRFVDEGPTVGWVHDRKNPNFPETGHDSWTSLPGFRSWIRKHHAKCL